MPSANDELAIITCSYAPDFQRCKRLCHSVDRWVAGNIHHRLIVPARDLHEFRTLENARRSVMAVEDVVPGRFWQMPNSERWWLDNYGWPVRGWIMQQVTKLSANFASSADALMFADSDLLFIRPFNKSHVMGEKGVRLHRIPGVKNTGEHLMWHHRAADLLGVHRQYFGSDYIGQLITWRREHLEGLQAHLEYINQKPWYRCISRSLRFSEYILYGAYIDNIVGLGHSGHFGCETDPCHCCWFGEDAQALADGTQPLREDAIALLLQSNMGLSEATESQILERIRPAEAQLKKAV